MSHFVHIHGAAGAGGALVAALERSLHEAREPGVVPLTHEPIVLPDADPLPVDQDARLLLCQIEGTPERLAAKIGAIARIIPGVSAIAHQAMTLERIKPGGPEEPNAPGEAVSWIVQYNGPAKDPRAFHDYYRQHHVPIVLRMPGIRSLNCYLPSASTPGAGLPAVNHLLLVQAVFDDVEGLLAMRRSPQRREGLRDFDNYPAFEGPVTHQAMRSRRI